jgi:hypothetical protein
MAEPQKQGQDSSQQHTNRTRRKVAPAARLHPTLSAAPGEQPAPQTPSLSQQIRAHTNRPHKGDVGRPGTNEEVFQGSKGKQLK